MIGVVVFALAGLVLGAAHFVALRWTVSAYLSGQRRAVAWYVARLVISGALLLALVRLGGPLVLVSLAGFVAARSLAVRRARRDAT